MLHIKNTTSNDDLNPDKRIAEIVGEFPPQKMMEIF